MSARPGLSPTLPRLSPLMEQRRARHDRLAKRIIYWTLAAIVVAVAVYACVSYARLGEPSHRPFCTDGQTTDCVPHWRALIRQGQSQP